MADPVTEQIGARTDWQRAREDPAELPLAAECLVEDAVGNRIPFGTLYKEQKTIVIFLRHFLCYICKEYVEDLGKIPKKFLQDANVRLVIIGQSAHHHIRPFCNLTGYPHEIYVDPRREIYKILGMKRGESSSSAVHSPHVKSSLLSGSIKSMWRAMTSAAFDFQGDPAQQGGTFILGPGKVINVELFVG
ncbi:PREDICTED: thioredoxin-like protein AAED1 [Thamnophis sirtalis]|uniref:Thioredoxin-like protein AAED1 n=1 Tax=Thamnophis sirtalis TaxID=35019 RepID=A0A6I9XQY9_9SAUR|nr:PREDICTED: thioredoxin-like protein AAED1 [Thamnophis sirtalis]